MIAKVVVNKEDGIHDDVVVSLGDCPRAASFTILIFILHAQNIATFPDEDELPPHGSLHPMPHPAPRWVGVEGEILEDNSTGAQVDDASVGNVPGLPE